MAKTNIGIKVRKDSGFAEWIYREVFDAQILDSGALALAIDTEDYYDYFLAPGAWIELRNLGKVEEEE